MRCITSFIDDVISSTRCVQRMCDLVNANSRSNVDWCRTQTIDSIDICTSRDQHLDCHQVLGINRDMQQCASIHAIIKCSDQAGILLYQHLKFRRAIPVQKATRNFEQRFCLRYRHRHRQIVNRSGPNPALNFAQQLFSLTIINKTQFI